MDSSSFESLTAEIDLAFPEYYTPPAEPLSIAERWLATAVRLGVREPQSMALATADKAGRVSNRIVAVLKNGAEGVLFTSHRCSRKGRDIAATGWASGLFYWRELGRQLVISGPVRQVPDAESDALWAARAVPLHAMSVASQQSLPLPDPAALGAAAQQLAEAGVALLRPDRFVGYRLEPAEVEFWSASPDRLHRRLHYHRDGDDWRPTRLQP
ncbi:phenazine biosynthesis FMN-dependent oxidase PhzG [Solwaraspora sp. WMMD791]|uniref:phenazine biosynthesis FMN-dependent oxidase PhzG n=1 Tax=Solwaraspora sp. WMMD791 TaxID=3016086 RepID=UPI00249A5A8A|nr:phenazine biosynthesis FMN-dependent oxidase PhzG [Solwaraspora sp. WMMD791]WFE26112.1 phenazine biosynthesis FMN-dependent oxidase PhzG [Solwaraspora sp. WMMD791]